MSRKLSKKVMFYLQKKSLIPARTLTNIEDPKNGIANKGYIFIVRIE